MTGLSALNLPQPLVWILAFAIIFGLLAAFAHLLKRIAGGRAAELEGGRNRIPRLGLVDSFDLDRHRKLIIVRRDNVEHLLLVGPSDVVVESNIVRAVGASPREERAAATMVGPALSPTPAMPIQPAPATPQAMQAASPPTPSSPAPVMPTAPFPVPPPVRPATPSKSTMPPPPPFGAPKRQEQGQQRVEPVLQPVPASTAKPAPKPEPEAAKSTPAAAAPEPAATAAAMRPVPSDEKPLPEASVTGALIKDAEPMVAPVMPVPSVLTKKLPDPAPVPSERISGIGEPITPAVDRKSTDPLPLELSAKLDDVLKVKIAADDVIGRAPARAPLPPLPPAPPSPNSAPATESGVHHHAPAPAGTSAEIAHKPEPAVAAPVAPSPAADAFEEELRRILGRAPQKG